MSDKTILRLPEVLTRTGLSRSSVYAKIATHNFPPSIKLGPRAVGWIADEVEAWIQSRIDVSRSSDEA